MSERQAIYTVRPRGEGKKDFWCRIGTGFQNRDGSWSIVLDAAPLDGRLVMRAEQQRDEEQAPRRQNSPQQTERRRPAASQQDFGGSNDSDEIPF